jgi:hypothetical protein
MRNSDFAGRERSARDSRQATERCDQSPVVEDRDMHVLRDDELPRQGRSLGQRGDRLEHHLLVEPTAVDRHRRRPHARRGDASPGLDGPVHLRLEFLAVYLAPDEDQPVERPGVGQRQHHLLEVAQG